MVEKYTNMVLGEEESVLFREVSLFQGRGVPLYFSGPKYCCHKQYFSDICQVHACAFVCISFFLA